MNQYNKSMYLFITPHACSSKMSLFKNVNTHDVPISSSDDDESKHTDYKNSGSFENEHPQSDGVAVLHLPAERSTTVTEVTTANPFERNDGVKTESSELHNKISDDQKSLTSERSVSDSLNGNNSSSSQASPSSAHSDTKGQSYSADEDELHPKPAKQHEIEITKKSGHLHEDKEHDEDDLQGNR